MPRLGIYNDGRGLGDQIQFTSFPENYFRNTAEKVVDIKNAAVFDHNPFVLRNVKCDQVYNVWRAGSGQTYTGGPCIYSVADRAIRYFNPDFKCFLRHPRLYRFEDERGADGHIVVHLGGRTDKCLSDEIVYRIRWNYPRSEILQVGLAGEKHYECFENAMGLPFWESVRVMARASTFIGVNSSIMNVALCYPWVSKRVVLSTADYDLASLTPMLTSNSHYHWLDHGLCLFNDTCEDIGVTYSYLKI